MKQERARMLTERLLKSFGLTGWSVHFVNFPPMPDEQKTVDGTTLTRPVRRLGLCSYRNQTISLSLQHIEEDDDNSVTQTICEEIGHALSRGDAEHGRRWKSARDRVWRALLETDDTTPRNALWYERHGRIDHLTLSFSLRAVAPTDRDRT
jgi:hypothetical protein